VAATAAGVISVFLPWVLRDSEQFAGISQPDGRVALFVGLAAVVLAWKRVAVGWIVAGFLAAFLGRDLYRLAQLPEAAAGWGLWLGAISFALAAVIQFGELARSRRSAT
jgi:hypothetical protein